MGHTHADIDARFGTIWVHFRSEFCLSLQEYESVICNIFKRKSFFAEMPQYLFFIIGNALKTHFTDVWVVPDYYKLCKPHIDKKFGNYSKGEQTQHQWIFEQVQGSFYTHLNDTYFLIPNILSH